jgi:hypothetical protein
MIISVIERRRRTLTVPEHEALEQSEGFWLLVDSGYVSYRRTGVGRHEIVGHKYVGRAKVGDVEIQVREKVPGALRALVRAATGGELRVELADSAATDFDAVSRCLMDEFTRSAGRYVAERRRPRYDYRSASGPLLAGSLDMAATIRLHASGRPGMFAYRQGRVVRDDPLDRLVLAGLDELDRNGAALGLERTTLYDARSLAGALEEVRDQRFVATTPSSFLLSSDAIERDPATLAEDADLARLATVALLHRGFNLEGVTVDRVPRAWFIDLEALFEQAVRSTLRDLLVDHEVDRGDVYARRMFIGGSDTSRTYPDVVVHRAGKVSSTGDVKYKTLTSSSSPQSVGGGSPTSRRVKEGRPDLYQLLVHAASLDSTHSFLVYPGERYVCRYLGRSATGCRTWTAQVRPVHLVDDLVRFANEAALSAT